MVTALAALMLGWALAPAGAAYAQAIVLDVQATDVLDWLGFSVAPAGDVDLDGTDDLIVGAPLDEAWFVPPIPVGSALLISGADASVLCTLVGDGQFDFDQFGFSVAGLGDVNGDATPDLAVGAPNDQTNGALSGSVTVYSGLTCVPIATFLGDGAGDQLGYSVAGAGDVNSDGVPDMIVGAPGNDAHGANSGLARVISGLTGLTLFTVRGSSAGDELGMSVSGAGDVNADGFDDVIVGVHGSDAFGLDSGSALVYSGLSGSLIYQFNGDSSFEWFGFSVAGAGDVDLDGYADLVVGAPFDDENGLNSGSASVLSGRDGSLLHRFLGESAGDQFGYSVAGAGDAAGSPHADLVVGAPWDDTAAGTDSGSATVFSGEDGSVLCAVTGDQLGDQLGFSVAWAGRVFAGGEPGWSDLVAGAPFWDSDGSGGYPGFDDGLARVFSCAPCDDVDSDGYGSPASPNCEHPERDCDDADPAVNPAALEICNGIDDDCDAEIDEGFDPDPDSDGVACGADCDDGNAMVYPGALELCDFIDNDCDLMIDEDSDVDTDGFTTCGGDCNDLDPSVNPDAVDIPANGVDENCNGIDLCGALPPSHSAADAWAFLFWPFIVGAVLRFAARSKR